MDYSPEVARTPPCTAHRSHISVTPALPSAPEPVPVPCPCPESPSAPDPSPEFQITPRTLHEPPPPDMPSLLKLPPPVSPAPSSAPPSFVHMLHHGFRLLVLGLPPLSLFYLHEFFHKLGKLSFKVNMVWEVAMVAVNLNFPIGHVMHQSFITC